MWDLLRLIQKGGIYMENRVYDMEKGQFAFLYKLPPKLILLLSTIVWLAAGLLIGAAAKACWDFL